MSALTDIAAPGDERTPIESFQLNKHTADTTQLTNPVKNLAGKLSGLKWAVGLEIAAIKTCGIISSVKFPHGQKNRTQCACTRTF